MLTNNLLNFISVKQNLTNKNFCNFFKNKYFYKLGNVIHIY